MTDGNPFDALDAQSTPQELEALKTFRQKNDAGFFETFSTARKAGYYQDTLLGHSLGNNEQAGAAANAAQADSNLPQWEDMSAIQAGAYVGGRLWGNMMSPENMIGVGVGAKALEYAGIKSASWGAKMFAGAVDAAVVNAPIDAGLQVMDIQAGKRDQFSVADLAASTALGSVIGAGTGAVHHAFGSMLGDEPVPKVYQDAKLAPPEAIKPNVVVDAVKPETPVPTVNAGQEGALPTPSIVAQQSAVQIPDNAIPQSQPDLAPALGDVLDARAREVRGLPPRVIPVEAKPSIVDSPNFKNWFGDSKTVDASGQPIKLFHGTQTNFSSFKEGSQPHFFTSNPDVANQYADKIGNGSGDRGGSVLPVYVKMENPLIVDGAGANWSEIPFRGSVSTTTVISSVAKTEGHDGVIFKNITDPPWSKDKKIPSDIYAVFDPKGVKSVHNAGQFDLNNPDILASLSQGPRAGQLQRDAAGVPLPQNASAEPPQFVRLQTTMENLSKALDATAVRMGRIAVKNADGIYKTKSGVIRLKNANDIQTLTHELGHHVEANIGKPLQDLMAAHGSELVSLVPNLDAYPASQHVQEGFANYMAHFVNSPAYVAQQAPQFDAAFRQYMAKDHGDTAKALNDAALAMKNWFERTSNEAVISTIVSRKKPKLFPKLREDLAKYGLGGTIHEGIHDMISGFIDHLDPFNQTVRSLAAVYKKNNDGKLINLESAYNPYDLAQGLAGALQAGVTDIMHGVTPFRGVTPESTPFRNAIIEAMGGANVLSKWNDVKLSEFDSYLKSKRMAGEWDRYDQGLIPNPADQLGRGDHVQNIVDMEAKHPSFANAAAGVYDFEKAIWKKQFEAGLITKEQYDSGLLVQDYVPNMRVFDGVGEAAKARGKSMSDAKSSFVKRVVGSQRDTYSAMESIVSNALEVNRAVAKNEMVRAFAALADLAGPGSGAFVERIPSHELKGVTFDLLEALKNKAKEQGLGEKEYLALRDQMESAFSDSAAATIFRPSVINEKGEAIAFFREAGELKAIRFADGEAGIKMHAAMNMMNQQESNLLIKILTVSANIKRFSVVKEPIYALFNFIRDQMMATIFYAKPIKSVVATAKGLRDEFLSRDAARIYSMMGGIAGGENSKALRDLHVNNDIQALRRKGYVANLLPYMTEVGGVPVPGFPIKKWLELTEITETGGRMGLFSVFNKEARGRGLSEFEALKEASHLSRDHLNFDRHGSQMQALNRLIPFLGASVQGLNKGWRVAIRPLIRKVSGDILTAAEQREVGQAAKAWGMAAAATVATTSLHALMTQHDEYNDFSPTTKATTWPVKIWGRWWFIPKPFEVSMALNVGPAAYDTMARHDPRAVEQYLTGLYDVMMPSNIMQGNPLIAEAYQQSTGVDLYTKQKIVPDNLAAFKDTPWQQYNQTTSQAFIDLGKAANISPMLMQHIFTQQTTSLGKTMLSLYDAAASDKPTQGWEQFALTRRFMKDVTRGASSTRAFWDLVGQQNGKLEGARKSWENMNQSGNATAATDFLAIQDATTKSWIAIGAASADVRRIHPYTRARSAVSAINDLLRDMVQSKIDTSKGKINVPANIRGVANDILEKLAMTEGRNALVIMKVPGWADRKVLETSGYYRELQALSPDLSKALADRFATAKVLPLDVVKKLWPETEKRLLRDGSSLRQEDLVARVKQAGFEMDGKAIKRKPRTKVEMP